MLKIAKGAAASPDENGLMYFEGQPYELQEGDTVLDDQYAVLHKTAGKHNGHPATTVTLCEPGEYWYEVPRGGEPQERGRVTLLNNTLIKFTRPVTDFDFGEENQLFYELTTCEHDEHDDYNHEWRGQCKDVPKGMLVGIHMEDETASPTMRCKIVDSAYENGVVVFSDGTAFQSHPNKEWIGWLTTADRSAEVLR